MEDHCLQRLSFYLRIVNASLKCHVHLGNQAHVVSSHKEYTQLLFLHGCGRVLVKSFHAVGDYQVGLLIERDKGPQKVSPVGGYNIDGLIDKFLNKGCHLNLLYYIIKEVNICKDSRELLSYYEKPRAESLL